MVIKLASQWQGEFTTMMTSTTIEAATSGRTLEELAQAFRRDGFLHLPGLISPSELEALQADSLEIVQGGWENAEHSSDYFHDILPDTGEDVFHRVQYVFPKARRGSFVTLLGHPFILELVQHLKGEDFVCAAEALVFKAAGNGREVTVHADCDPSDPKLAPIIFNVDVYLDDSSVENGCLWVAPQTHAQNLSGASIAAQGFDFPGLQPLPVQAGDVLLHDIRLVHGSPRSQGGALRRTLYYEFQSLAEMDNQGGPRPGFPHTKAYVRDRIRLLMHAVEQRKQAPYAQDEEAFDYNAPAGYDVEPFAPGEPVNLRPALGYNKYF